MVRSYLIDKDRGGAAVASPPLYYPRAPFEDEESDGPQRRMASVVGEPITGMYFGTLGAESAYPRPIVFIHEGGRAGTTCWPIQGGRDCWEDLVAIARCGWRVADWVGSESSKYCHNEPCEYCDPVDGFVQLLTDVTLREMGLFTQAMLRAITWKLLQIVLDLIVGIIMVEAVHAANIQERGTIGTQDGLWVEAMFADIDVIFDVDRTHLYFHSHDYFDKPALIRRTPPMVPERGRAAATRCLLLHRIGVVDEMPMIEHYEPFGGKMIWLIATPRNGSHTSAIDERNFGRLRTGVRMPRRSGLPVAVSPDTETIR